MLACVDIPLSLIGDVLTLPVVYARVRREPWATNWGEQWPPPKEEIERFWLSESEIEAHITGQDSPHQRSAIAP